MPAAGMAAALAATARISQADAAMADKKQLSLILGNATRLLDDARLLVDCRRYASAFALALLGVEEIGKVLLRGWEAEQPLPKPKERQSLHIQKQAAVATLLNGALLARMFPTVDWKTLDIDAVTKAFNDSDEGKLLALIRDGHLDRRKRNALYQDDDLITAVEEGIAELQVDGILKIASAAQEALASPFNRAAARAFYEATVLGVSVSDRLESQSRPDSGATSAL